MEHGSRAFLVIGVAAVIVTGVVKAALYAVRLVQS